jgi:hypothetical protein
LDGTDRFDTIRTRLPLQVFQGALASWRSQRLVDGWVALLVRRVDVRVGINDEHWCYLSKIVLVDILALVLDQAAF